MNLNSPVKYKCISSRTTIQSVLMMITKLVSFSFPQTYIPFEIAEIKKKYESYF